MNHIPETTAPDSTLKIATDGYNFVSEQCRELNTDIFSTRLMMKKTICMKGREAAKVFYNPDFLERKNVPPNFIKSTLLGKGGVQGLDGDAHTNRKRMFMKLMNHENIHRLSEIIHDKWVQYATEWEKQDEVVLFYEVEKLICEAICEWTGVPLEKDKVEKRARQLGYMIEGAGTFGLRRHIQGRAARNDMEKWIQQLVEKIRDNEGVDDEPSEEEQPNALYRFVWHKDSDGDLLDSHTVAVEILNLLRPTVAVSRYIIFSALALHEFPENKVKLQAEEDFASLFVDEVRRYYPFFPFNMARVKREFKWKDYYFPEGTQVLLDFYGTNHDERLWEDPQIFNPERFRNREEDAYDLVPQGGGDYVQNHRCAGEWITVELMKQAISFLTESIDYNVPDQDLDIDLATIPAIPKSRFIISDVHFK